MPQCPICGVALSSDGICRSCNQQIANEFHASGIEAMAVQEKIVIHHNKMVTVRAIAAYSVSVIFVIVGAFL